MDTKDALLRLCESENVLGMIVLVYEKGGEGPEGIVCHTFADKDINQVPNISAKLRALADKWETEHK